MITTIKAVCDQINTIIPSKPLVGTMAPIIVSDGTLSVALTLVCKMEKMEKKNQFNCQGGGDKLWSINIVDWKRKSINSFVKIVTQSHSMEDVF